MKLTKAGSKLTGRVYGVYADKECTKSLFDETIKSPLAKFKKLGIAGKEQKITVYVRNECPDEFIVEKVGTPPNTDVELENSKLKPDVPVRMTVSWTPEAGRESALFDDINLQGHYVIRPRGL